MGTNVNIPEHYTCVVNINQKTLGSTLIATGPPHCKDTVIYFSVELFGIVLYADALLPDIPVTLK